MELLSYDGNKISRYCYKLNKLLRNQEQAIYQLISNLT